MPKVFEYNGYRFFFFSNEGNPLEPIHIHVQKGECIAKFWIEPHISLENSYGFKSGELNLLEKIIFEKSNLIQEKWHEFFSS